VFLNTWHADGPRERFDSPERMRDWLAKRMLIAPAHRVSAAEFACVRRMRHGMRLLLAASGAELPAAELGAINELARKAELIVQFDDTGRSCLTPGASGVPAAMARIFAAVAAGQLDDTWSRLKVCSNAECQRVFYDMSKNHSAVWCSSQRCGNRMNARAYRARGAGT
jgi:predicted RNA-binding Zn ribbon-like protein